MNRAEVMSDEIARWKSSGLSLLAYAKQSTVSYQRLLYWRSKLNGDHKVKAKSTGSTAKLVPVRVVADATLTAAVQEPFEVWLANGVALNVTAGFDERELRRLIDVLSAC